MVCFALIATLLAAATNGLILPLYLQHYKEAAPDTTGAHLRESTDTERREIEAGATFRRHLAKQLARQTAEFEPMP